jgi:uncharacterized protein YjlB
MKELHSIRHPACFSLLIVFALFSHGCPKTQSRSEQSETSEVEPIMTPHDEQTPTGNPFAGVLNEPQVQTPILEDDGTFPNNQVLPAMIYKNAVKLPADDPAAVFEELFADNHWGRFWRNGIYGYHHYHSTAHEALGCYSGSAKVQLGGPEGVTLTIEAGDVVVLPAGTAHRNLGDTSDFGVVGAYPRGQTYDMNYGRAGERPRADRNIAAVPLPEADPIYGESGPLMRNWKSKD